MRNYFGGYWGVLLSGLIWAVLMTISIYIFPDGAGRLIGFVVASILAIWLVYWGETNHD